MTLNKILFFLYRKKLGEMGKSRFCWFSTVGRNRYVLFYCWRWGYIYMCKLSRFLSVSGSVYQFSLLLNSQSPSGLIILYSFDWFTPKQKNFIKIHSRTPTIFSHSRRETYIFCFSNFLLSTKKPVLICHLEIQTPARHCDYDRAKWGMQYVTKCVIRDKRRRDGDGTRSLLTKLL